MHWSVVGSPPRRQRRRVSAFFPTAALAIALLAAASGCSNGPPPASGQGAAADAGDSLSQGMDSSQAGDASSAEQSVCATLAKASCAAWEKCMAWSLADSSAASCIAAVQQSCEVSLALPGSGYTAAAVAACAAATQSANCGQQLALAFTTCKKPKGNLATNAPCLEDQQCQSGDCSAVTAGQSNGCGKCQLQAQLGQPCTSGVGCSDELVCSSGVCVALVAPGAKCIDPLQCFPHGFCGKDGTCQPLLTAGAPCKDGIGCSFLDGLYCSESKGVCVPFGVAKLGEPCDLADPSDPEKFTFCSYGNSCVHPAVGAAVCQADSAVGGACGTDETPRCQSGLACQSGKCVLKTAVLCGG